MVLELVEPTVISGGLAVTAMLKLTTGSGGLGDCGVPPPPLGSVGDEVQLSASARAVARIRANNRRGAFLRASIPKLLPGSRPDFKRKGGRCGGDLVAGKRTAEERERDVQNDHRRPGLAIHPEIQQILERLAQDLIAEQDRQVDD